MINQQNMIIAARMAHEANRTYCGIIGDPVAPKWDGADSEFRNSILQGVKGVLAGNSPEQSHACWLKEREAAGWKYGPVKDPEKKEHPCMLPYNGLSEKQQKKDHIFVAVVRAILGIDNPVLEDTVNQDAMPPLRLLAEGTDIIRLNMKVMRAAASMNKASIQNAADHALVEGVTQLQQINAHVSRILQAL